MQNDMNPFSLSHNSDRPGARLAVSVGLLVLLAGSGPDGAAAQKLQFRHITPNDGLAGSRVHDILQDSRGFMWFGTANGLNRFDGYQATVYRRERNNPHSLSNGEITDLYEDREGTLWVATRGGVSRYDRQRDHFDNYIVEGAALHSSAARPVASLLEDSYGNFWLGSGGLYRLDRKTGRATPYEIEDSLGLASAWIQVLHEDSRQRVWIGTNDRGLYELNPATGAVRRFRNHPQDPESLPDNDVRTLVEDPSGQLWIGTYNAGVVRLDPRTGQMTRYQHDSGNPRSVAGNRILRLIADREQGLWVGTESGGLDYFDFASGAFSHNQSDETDPTRLNSNSIWSLYQDSSGLLWVGTYSGGIRVARAHDHPIRHFTAAPGIAGRLSNFSVRGFTEDPQGNIWIAVDGGGLNQFNPRTGRFTEYSTWNSGLGSASVLAVAADPDGGVWAGTWEGGLSHFDPRTNQFSVLTSQNSGLLDNNIFALHVDRRGRLWIGTRDRGLLFFDRSRKSFVAYNLARPGEPESQIWTIRETHDGNFLIGTNGHGLVVFNPATGRKRAYVSNPRDANTLAGSDVRAVLESEPGIIWVGTGSGLDRLDLRTGKIEHFAEEDGLPSSLIAGLAKDRAGNVWISTNRGVSRFDPKSRTFQNYGLSHGLQGNEFHPGSVFRSSNGTIYFGGNNGFNTVHPERIVRNERKPRVVITGFHLFNKPVRIAGEGSPLKSHISETKELTLSHEQDVFTFDFAALDYADPGRNRYAYKLEGFDSEWNAVGHNRSATYTNLPAGRYLFRVKASNSDGVWNEEGASIRIIITPPYWEAWWFRSLVVLALAAVAFAWVRSIQNRRRQLEAMNAGLETANARLTETAERSRLGQQYLEDNVIEILDAMQRFSHGDHSVALDVRTGDAIGKLRLGFNSVVADRKQTEDELRQSQKMDAVGRLAGGIAHDFNNLLMVIAANTELALQDLQDSSVREELEEVGRAADSAASLTQQLLAFGRGQVLQPRDISINEVVERVARMLLRTLGEDIELRLDMDPALGLVRADPGQVEQVLLNLALNARDAMPRGGELTIQTRNGGAERTQWHGEAAPGPHVVLTVRDTGAGMEEAVRERIFEPFFTTKAKGKGTGLGLSTVYGIINQSGGRLRVESEPGKGSTFTILLPCLQRVDTVVEPASAGGSLEHPGYVAGSETVLLAEDEGAVRLVVCRLLKRAGYTVLAAASGAEALRVAEEYEGDIDLLLTDVVMPGMSGRELAERLLPTRPGTGLLYMSGYTEDAIVHHGVSSLGTRFLGKPFAPAALARAVREALEERPVVATRG